MSTTRDARFDPRRPARSATAIPALSIIETAGDAVARGSARLDPSAPGPAFDGPPACMARSTRIWMSNGSDKPIERVRAGDLVTGANGEANPVLAVEIQQIGQHPLYALNGGSFFITGTLPLMTLAGWKLLDPAALNGEAGDTDSESLRIGDELAVRAMAYRTRIVDGELPAPSTMEFVVGRLDFIKLATIETIIIDPAATVHAVRIGGTGSYFAGGFLART